MSRVWLSRGKIRRRQGLLSRDSTLSYLFESKCIWRSTLRQLRDKLRLAQVFLALFATLLSAVPEMKGLHGFKIAEIELLEPIEKQATEESAAPKHRISEDIEESVVNGAPDARIRGFSLALSDGAHLRRCAESWTPLKRTAYAHPPTGPPAV